MKKMLVSDYDQTFYLNDEDILKNKKAVERFKKGGHVFFIATGRNFYDFKKKEELYNLDVDYKILDHGATIIDNKDKMLFNKSLPNDFIESIIDELDLKKAIKYFASDALESRVEFNHRPLTKIYVKYKTKTKAQEIFKKLDKNFGDLVTIHYLRNESLEIVSKEVDKSKAILFVANLENIDPNNIYTIGDGYSDIGMIKKFNGYAMSDSLMEVKKVSKKEYESVSLLIEDILNNKE